MPTESESSFIERSLGAKSTLDLIKQHLPAAPDLSLSSLDISSDSLLAFTSNRKLLFMHGAITLVASVQEIINYLQECSVISRIPIPEQEGLLSCIHLREKNRFYRLYSQEEVVGHEMIHAARHLFNSSRFEEILAFQTSPNLFRRFLGPISQRPYESYLFMLVFIFLWIFSGYQRLYQCCFLSLHSLFAHPINPEPASFPSLQKKSFLSSKSRPISSLFDPPY